MPFVPLQTSNERLQMKPMDHKYKKENALLRNHKETTLEKNQADRIARRKLIANKLKDLDKEVK